MAKQLFYYLFICLFLMLSACVTNSTREIPDDVISDDYENVDVGDGSEAIGIDNEGDLSMSQLNDGGNVIYFDYNSAQIRDDSLPLIASVAKALTAYPTQQLRLEGHADERGTREYNLALGEQRAQSVRDLILLQGASGNQIDLVSYGEEKPAVIGSSEESWQRNRRVELVY